jgi:hypothetical protein
MNEHLFYRLSCECADRPNIRPVAMDGTGVGMCSPDVSRSSMVTKVQLPCVTFLLFLQFALQGNQNFIYEAIKIVKFSYTSYKKL